MFSQYTWGQFGLFLFAVVAVYYVVAILYFYRGDYGALFRKGGGGLPAPAKAAATSAAPPALVRTKSGMGSKAAAAPVAAVTGAAVGQGEEEEEEEEEQGSLPAPSEAVVNGSLPESTATPGTVPTLGSQDEDDEEGEESTAAAADSDENGDENEELESPEMYSDDEQTTDGLEEADQGLMEMLRGLSLNGPQEETTVEDQTPETVLLPEFSFELEPIAEEPIAAIADVLPVAEQLYTASSVAEFIAQVQAGVKPSVPAEMQDTSLAAQMADLMMEHNNELVALLGSEA